MQYLVSGYSNWHAKRHRRPGHLTQGRYKAALVEDERYFWTVSRYSAVVLGLVRPLPRRVEWIGVRHPFFPRVLVHLVGLGLIVRQRRAVRGGQGAGPGWPAAAAADAGG